MSDLEATGSHGGFKKARENFLGDADTDRDAAAVCGLGFVGLRFVGWGLWILT